MTLLGREAKEVSGISDHRPGRSNIRRLSRTTCFPLALHHALEVGEPLPTLGDDSLRCSRALRRTDIKNHDSVGIDAVLICQVDCAFRVLSSGAWVQSMRSTRTDSGGRFRLSPCAQASE